MVSIGYINLQVSKSFDNGAEPEMTEKDKRRRKLDNAGQAPADWEPHIFSKRGHATFSSPLLISFLLSAFGYNLTCQQFLR